MMSKCVRLVFVMLLASSPAAADEAPVRALPARFVASVDLRRHMEAMLQRSATFRQQCQRLDAPGVRVVIRRDPTMLDRQYRARTTIHRTVTGVLIASMTITAFGDPTEWLAHEFEHLVEQLDGVRLRRLAAEGRGDVWPANDDMFETARAIRAGRLVREEVRGSARILARAAVEGS